MQQKQLQRVPRAWQGHYRHRLASREEKENENHHHGLDPPTSSTFRSPSERTNTSHSQDNKVAQSVAHEVAVSAAATATTSGRDHNNQERAASSLLRFDELLRDDEGGGSKEAQNQPSGSQFATSCQLSDSRPNARSVQLQRVRITRRSAASETKLPNEQHEQEQDRDGDGDDEPSRKLSWPARSSNSNNKTSTSAADEQQHLPLRHHQTQATASTGSQVFQLAVSDTKDDKVQVIKKQLSDQRAGSSNSLPLIHTDQLNASTRLLYIRPPSRFSAHNRQFIASRPVSMLHNNHQNRRRPKSKVLDSLEPQAGGQLVMAGSESSMAPNSAQLRARFEVLNLEVTNSTATLTWSLSLFPLESEVDEDPKTRRQDSLARGKRDTNSVRPTLSGRNSFGDPDSEELTMDFDARSNTDIFAEVGDNLELVKRNGTQQHQQQREPKRRFKSRKGATSTTLPPPPSTTEIDDILRNISTRPTAELGDEANLTSSGPRPQPVAIKLLPSAGPTKRPPKRMAAKQQLQLQISPVAEAAQDTETPQLPTNTTTSPTTRVAQASSQAPTTITTSTSSAPTTRLQRLPLQHRTSPTAADRQEATNLDQEPPIIHFTSAPLNRIFKPTLQQNPTKTSSTTTTTTTTTTNSPQTSTITQSSTLKVDEVPITAANKRETTRASKSLKELEDQTSAPNSTPSTTRGSEIPQATTPGLTTSSTSTTTTSTVRPTETPTSTTVILRTQTPSSLPSVDRQSTRASDQLDALTAATGRPIKTTTTTPSSTTSSSAPAQSTPNQVITMTKSQLVTSESLERARGELVARATTSPPPPLLLEQQEQQPKKLHVPLESQATASEQHNSAMSSKWFVRLRRFGSNEVDLVRVVVHDLGQLLERPLVRSISFKNLEPSSGYEICVESASPSQLIGDKFHILNANYFLKCQDISDVELSNSSNSSLIATPETEATNSSSSQQTLKRMDVNREDELRLGRPAGNLPTSNSTRSAHLKMKSLCREFFTLPTVQLDLVVANQTLPSPGEQQTRAANIALGQANSSDHPRRPKSLIDQQKQQEEAPQSSNALKSHMELMEIDLSQLMSNSTNERPLASVFEVISQSRHSANGIPLAHSESTLFPGGGLNSIPTNWTNRGLATKQLLDATTSADQPTHILSIVGCVFVLIFLASIANMLMNLIHCHSRSSLGGAPVSGGQGDILTGQAGGRLARHLGASRRRRRRRRLTEALANASTHQPLGAHSPTMASPALRPANYPPPSIGNGSYYSAGSDHSATSKSRIVVIGKNGEPFGSASGYFDMPPERHHLGAAYGHISPGAGSLMRNSKTASPRKSGSPSDGHPVVDPTEAATTRSMYLLTAAASFPLGPSFEGDEKHNADMVGLARRNYDNFISSIYNDDQMTSEVLANARLHSGRQTIDNSGLNHHQRHHQSSCKLYQREREQGHADQELHVADNQYQQVVVSTSTRSSNSPPGQMQPNQQRQRIRFDKVNPIYNMDSAMQTGRRRTPNGSQLQQQQQRGSLTSFGQHQQSPADSASTTSTGINNNGTPECADQQEELDCSLCQNQCNLRSNLNGQSDDEHTLPRASQTSPGLDRQKQRIKAQQQQLERVLTKSGSLLPQPFINVTVGADLASGKYAYPQEALGNEQHLDKSSKFTVDYTAKDDTVEAQQHHDLEQRDKEGAEANMPSPPPPPPPLSPTGEHQKSKDSKPLTQLQPVDRDQRDETIERSDFNQRRNELASKLHLPGMAKQQQQ